MNFIPTLLILTLGSAAIPAAAQFSGLSKLKEAVGKATSTKESAKPASTSNLNPAAAPAAPLSRPASVPEPRSAAGTITFATAPLELGPDGKPRTVGGKGRITNQFQGGEWIYALIQLPEPIKSLVGKASAIPEDGWSAKETIEFTTVMRPVDAPSSVYVPKWFMEHSEAKANKHAISVAILVPAEEAKQGDVWAHSYLTSHYRCLPTAGKEIQDFTFSVAPSYMNRQRKEVVLARGRIELALNEAGRQLAESVLKGNARAKASEARMPRGARKDAALEAKLKQTWEAYSAHSKVLRVVIDSSDWEAYVDAQGAKRSKLQASLATKERDGSVECTRILFERPWTGSGWSAIKVAGIGGTFPMLEENVTK